MKCRRAKALIFDFIDGLIGDSDRIALEQHLCECASCEAMAAGLKSSLDLLHRAPQAELDENFNWKVRLAITKERNTAARGAGVHGAWLRAWNMRAAASAAATFAVVIAAGYFAVRSLDGIGGAPALVASEMSQDAVSRPEAQPVSRRDLVPSPGATGYGPGMKTVSTGPQSAGSGPNGLFEDFDADSLANRFRQTRELQWRARLLEEQVRFLQGELSNCQGEGNP